MTYYLSGALASQNSASIDQAITGGLPLSVNDFTSPAKENLTFDFSPSAEYMLKTTFMGTGSFGSDPGNDYDPGMIIYQSGSSNGYEIADFIKLKGSRALDSAFYYADSPNLLSPRFLSDDTIVIACDAYDPQDGSGNRMDGAFIVVTGSGTNWGISQVFSGSTSYGVTSTAQSRDANLGGPSVIADFVGNGDQAKMFAANNKYSSTLATRVAIHNYGGHASAARPQGMITIFQQSGGTWSFHSQFSQEDLSDYVNGSFSSGLSVHDMTWIDENNMVIVYFADGSTDYSYMIAVTWNESTSKWEISGYDSSEMTNYAYKLATRVSLDVSTSGVQGIRFVEYDPFSERLLMGYQGDSIWMFQSASNWLRDDLYGSLFGKGNTSEENDHGHSGVLGVPPFGHKQHMRFAFANDRTTIVGVQARYGSEATAANSAWNSLVYHESSSAGWSSYDISYNGSIYQGRMRHEFFSTGSITLAAEASSGLGINPYTHSRQTDEQYGAKTAFTMNSTNGGDGNTFAYHEADKASTLGSYQKDNQRILVGNFGAFPAANPSLASSVTSSIGSSGGTLSAGGTQASPKISVTVPSNALSGDTSLSAEVMSNADYKASNLGSIKTQAGSSGAYFAGDIIRLTPHGQQFSQAATVQFILDSAPDDLTIWKRDSHEGGFTQWYQLPDNLWSNSGTTVTISTTKFSEYAGIGGINVARTKLNNSQLVTLTATDLVDSTSIRVSGSNSFKNLSVAATDLFVIEQGGGTYHVSASQMAEYFGGLVSVSASSDNVDMRMTFVSPTDDTDIGLAVDAGIKYNPSSNTLKGANLSGSGTLQIAGNSDMAGTLDVVGLISGSGGIDIAGTADFGAAVNVQGALDVDGATTLDGLTVAEAAVFSSTLSATGLISGSGGIDIAGTADFGAAVNVEGALDVDGATTLDGLTVAEAAVFSSTLSATGLISGSGGIDIAGSADFGAAVNIEGALDVDGATTLDGLTVAEAAVFSSTVSATGLISGSGGIDIAGAADFGAAVNVQGALDVDGATTLDGLTVAEAAVFSSTLSATGLISGSGGIDIAGAADFGAAVNVQGALDVDGATTLDGLTVAEAAAFSSTVTATGLISGSGGIDIAGTADFGAAVNVQGALDVDGATTLDGLTVAEDAAFQQDVVITGDLTVNGDTTVISTTNLEVQDSLILFSSGASGTPANDQGFIFDRGAADNAAMLWDESTDRFVFANVASASADSTGNLAYSAYPVSASLFYGDGSNLLNVGATIEAASSDDIDLQLLFTSQSGTSQTLFIDSGSLKYNSNSNMLKAVNLSGSGTLQIAGNSDMAGTLDVVGLISGAAGIDIAGTADFGAAVNVQGALDVDGATTLDGLTVAEAAVFSSTLSATGLISGSGGIDIAGAADFGAAVNVQGALDVDGATTLDGLTVAEAAVMSSTLSVTGLISGSGGIDIAGSADFGAAVNAQGAISGSSHLQIAGNSDMAGTLDVVGLISGSGGIDIGGTADFGAAVNIQGALDVDGATTLDGLTVAEAAIMSSTLSVTGLISGSGGMDIAGTADFGAAVNVEGALDVDGATTLDGLTVAEAAVMSSTLSVTGLISGSGGMDMAGTADFGSAVNVQGLLSGSGGMDMAGTADFGAAVNIQGALDVDGATTVDAITASDTATFNGAVNLGNSGADAIVVSGALDVGNQNTKFRSNQVELENLDSMALDSNDSTHFLLVQDSDNNYIKKESVTDLVQHITGAAGTRGGIQVHQGKLFIAQKEESFMSASLTGHAHTASMSGPVLSGSLMVFLNGLLQTRSGSANLGSGANSIFDYRLDSYTAPTKVLMADALDSDDVLIVRYIQK